MKWIADWLRTAADRSVLQRCLLTALVVGTVLTLITHGDVLFSPNWDTGLVWQIGLLYLAPFVVSSVASVTAMHRQRRMDQHNLLLTGQQIETINRFPNQNPNPVMRVSRDGEFTYANLASAPIMSGPALT
ncbi:MAG: hypothetical protein WD402_03255, partial [Chloroflexota bacterium]